MYTEKQKLLIITLGKLSYLDNEALKHFGFGYKVLKKCIDSKLIVIAEKKYTSFPTLYFLTNKGRKLFKELTNEKISVSRSQKHDYYHLKNVIHLLSLDNIHSYKSERYIRDKYREIINYQEKNNNISISCPDCCFISSDNKLIYIETLIDYSNEKLERKKNFALVDKDIELIIVRKNNKKIYHSRGGETLWLKK